MRRIERLSESPSPRRFEREFIALPKALYEGCPYWVPQFDLDVREALRKRHPYFLRADAEFFLLRSEGGRAIGRMCATLNPAYQRQHGRSCAHFSMLDAVDDAEAFAALADAASRWASARGATSLEGPLLYGGSSGSGILVRGFDKPAPMTMMAYNHSYYGERLEQAGFTKLFDLYGADISPGSFKLPERVESLARKVLARGRFSVLRFRSKREILARADEIARMYNATLADHPENYPLSEAEIERVKKDLLLVADPALVKILAYDGAIVGYLFAFPDASEAMRKNGGRLGPVELLRLLAGLKRARKALFNGMGILPDYQRLGGNALLYAELAETIGSRSFEEAEVVQIAESTELMLRDIERLGAKVDKVHRVYSLPLAR